LPGYLSATHDFASGYVDAKSRLDAGDLRIALSLAAKADHESATSDPVWNYKIRTLEAEILLWQGLPENARKMIDHKPPPGMPLQFVMQNKLTLARTLYNLREFSEAASRIMEVEAYARRTNPRLLPDVLLAKGTLSLVQGRFREAERLLLDALTKARRVNDKVVETKTLGTLSKLYTSKEQYDAAIGWAQAAMKINQLLHARHFEAAIKLNMAWSYLELGDFEQSVPLFKEVENLAAAAGMNFIREAALNNLGRIELDQGKYLEAKNHFATVLAGAESRKGGFGIADYLDNIALADVGLKQLDEAEKFNQKAIRLYRDNHDRVGELRALVNAASLAVARGNFDQAEPQFKKLIADKDTPASLRWEAEDELARLYVKSGRADLAGVQFRRVLQTLILVRRQIRDPEHRLAFSSRAVSFYTNYIRFLVGHGASLTALQVAESMRARTLEEGLGGGSTSPAPVQLSDVQAYLRMHNQTILAYWLSPESSFLWAITPSRVQLFTIPAKQEIDAQVEKYQKAIAARSDIGLGDEGGQALYRMLVQPAIGLIPEGAKVEIIPYGSLGKLNFETLLVPGRPPHFWIEDVELESASSMALLIRPKVTSAAKKKLLLIGNPVRVSDDYQTLAYAESEMVQISQRFSGAEKRVISGKAAFPSAYASVIPRQYEIIHFVTHGSASSTRPLDSAIVLSPEPGLSAQQDPQFKLYGREIVKNRLNARVVVISACYGAGKRTYSAEGLVGLAWAFLRAGAHQVIAGLWDVDDESTPKLMNDFYAGFLQSRNAAGALRAAKLKMLKSKSAYRRPYFWASLQLYTGS
jgi:CHAT domain-containing protein